MWCVAALARESLAQMEDVLATYEKPLDATAPVVGMDEKPVSRHDEVRPGAPAAPGRIATRDHQYQRCGTANVVCAVEPKAGVPFTGPTANRAAAELAQVLGQFVAH